MTRGVRFAPSPTGSFHVGNLRTAWISAWLAKELREPWVVRFEDIDRPRILAGAQRSQLEDFSALGLSPDVVIIQSARLERHLELFERARESSAVYPCYCSRKEVLEATAQAASAPHGEVPLYSGRCRARVPNSQNLEAPTDYSNPSVAWRFRNADESGAQDFIVARTSPAGTDFAPAYHWACAIDDFDGDYRLLVRAWDLAPAAAQQRAVFEWLAGVECITRAYPPIFHTSLVTQDDGHRLEKRTKGVTLAELKAEGRDVKWLLSRFEESFVDRKEASEKRRELRLGDLFGAGTRSGNIQR